MKKLALAFFLTMSAPALALPPLSEVKSLNDGLRVLFIADQLRIACPSLDARMVKGWAFAYSLQRKARDMGYSGAQIEDFVESKKQRRRLEGETDRYLKKHGVRAGQPETYCALGHQEIAKGSQIGAFLKTK